MQSTTNTKGPLTEGSIFKALVRLATPIVITNLLQTAYQLTDTFWVGRLGVSAIAAVSISFPIIFLTMALGIGFSIAGTVLVAQYKGQQNNSMINHVASQSILIICILSIPLTLLGYYFAETLSYWLGANGTTLIQTVSYLKISFLGTIFVFIYFTFQSILRGVGHVNLPVYIILSTVILNLFLDPFFIFGYGSFAGLGVSGAALATVITQALSSFVGLYVLLAGHYDVKLKPSFALDLTLIKKMFFIGLPASVEFVTRALGISIMTILVASFGTQIVATYGIGTRVITFIIIPALGLSMATSTLVGQNIGAGKADRAYKTGLYSAKITFAILSVIGVLIYYFAEPISAIFVPTDASVIAESAKFIRIMSLTYGFIGLQLSLNGAFQGAGKTTLSMMLAIVSIWLFQFPIAYILSNTYLQESGLWYAFPITNICMGIVGYLIFVNGSWLKSKVIK